MTTQAIMVLLYWASEQTIETQHGFAEVLSKELEYYNSLKTGGITARVMDILIKKYTESIK